MVLESGLFAVLSADEMMANIVVCPPCAKYLKWFIYVILFLEQFYELGTIFIPL